MVQGAPGAAAPGPSVEQREIDGYVWDGKEVDIEYERDPLPGGFVDERESVEGTGIVYRKLYLDRGINCSVKEAPMVPTNRGNRDFLVYYAPDSAIPPGSSPGSKVAFIVRKGCVGDAGDIRNFRFLSGPSEDELKGDSALDAADRERIRKRNTDIGMPLFFYYKPFPWLLVPQSVPEGTYTIAPLYGQGNALSAWIERLVRIDPPVFEMKLTLAPSSYIYDRLKIRFI
jgi:hypothetical protein